MLHHPTHIKYICTQNKCMVKCLDYQRVLIGIPTSNSFNSLCRTRYDHVTTSKWLIFPFPISVQTPTMRDNMRPIQRWTDSKYKDIHTHPRTHYTHLPMHTQTTHTYTCKNSLTWEHIPPRSEDIPSLAQSPLVWLCQSVNETTGYPWRDEKHTKWHNLHITKLGRSILMYAVIVVTINCKIFNAKV